MLFAFLISTLGKILRVFELKFFEPDLFKVLVVQLKLSEVDLFK